MSEVFETCRDLSELTENAQIACRLFLKKCSEKGLKVRITETYRPQRRQNYLYEQGRTRSGSIVTWTKHSRHTSRRAWDICQNIKGKEYSDAEFFESCGKIAQTLGITWGGTWKQADTPHFEISADWTPKEEGTIEVDEIKGELNHIKTAVDRLGDRITALENPMIYNYIDDNMPSWARETISKLEKNGIIKGDSDGLGLNYETLRLLAILDRGGVFERLT